MATTFTYVSLENLQQYDSLLKPYIEGKVADGVKSSFKTVAIEGNTLKFYNVDAPVGSTVPVYSIDLPETDVSGLVEKIKNAVAGDVVIANADGTIADSGVKLADLAKSADVTTEIGTAKEDVEKKIKANTDAIAKLNGGETDDGSIAKAVKDASDALNAKISANKDVLNKLDGTVAVEGSVKKQIKDAKDALQEQITQNKDVIDKLDGAASVEGSVKKQIADAKAELEGKITSSEYDDTEVRSLINANKDAISTLNGEGVGSVKKSVDDALNDFATKVSDDGVVNTYKELIDYAAEHKGEAATMAGDIAKNKTAIADLDKKVGTIPEGSDAADVISYVDKTSAKALADAKTYSDGLAKNYATAEQGAKADTALQEKDVATLRTDVADVKASLAEGGATDTAIKEAKSAADAAQTDLNDTKKRIDALEDVKYIATTEDEIKALFPQE